MKRIAVAGATLALVLSLAGPATAAPSRVTDPDAPRSLPAEGPVQVTWDDPAQFSEIRRSGNRWEAERGNWVHDLAEYLRDAAEDTLLPGQTMKVHITDIARAGNYEPGRGPQLDDVRVVRDLYPPRLSFRYVRYGANGQVVDEGERTLSDLGFLTGSAPLGTDPLRYEKRMIDRWESQTRRDGREVSAR